MDLTNFIAVCNRILNKFLDNYQEDLLPWHESIEPSLSSMTACINDREVAVSLHIHTCVRKVLSYASLVFLLV